MIEVYRVGPAVGSLQGLEPVLDMAAPSLPPGYSPAAAERLAAQALAGSKETQSIEALGTSGDLLHAASVIRAKADGHPSGVVVATDYLTGDLAARSRRMTQAFEDYNQLRVLKRPLTGVYLSFFLMVTLMILVGAIWMGLYLAKRITRPVQMLAAAAREIGAGRLDQHLEPQSDDEFGALTEAFNAMAGELATSRRKVERSTIELERKHLEVERRRRYIETILERITTGVISVDATGSVTTINSAALRLLNLDPSVVGQPVRAIFARPDLETLSIVLTGSGRGASMPVAQELAMSRDGQELHLAVVATSLVGDSGIPEGQILVLDDVTPLIRAQKVAAWREVARRLAHEIKNPLTPIQLSAERLRRHFTDAPSGARALVDECTTTIVGEVESLKGLVDEFSQFARMPTPRTVPTDLRALIVNTLALYDGLFTDVTIEHRFGGHRPGETRSRADPAGHHQPRRQRHRSDGTPRPHFGRNAVRQAESSGPHHRGRRWARDSGVRTREAFSAVLLDEATGQRPRPGDRPPHHRGAWRQHRRERQRAARHSIYNRASGMRFRAPGFRLLQNTRVNCSPMGTVRSLKPEARSPQPI